MVGPLAHRAAYARTIELRHHPIEQSQAGPVLSKQMLSRKDAVFHGGNFIAGALQSLLEQTPRHSVVIRDQYPQDGTPARHASISSVSWRSCCSSACRVGPNPAA